MGCVPTKVPSHKKEAEVQKDKPEPAKTRQEHLDELARLKIRHQIRLRMYGCEECLVPRLHISANPLYQRRQSQDLARVRTTHDL